MAKCSHHAVAQEVVKGRLYAGAGMLPTPVPAGAVVLDLAGKYEPTIRVEGLTIRGLDKDRKGYIRVEWPDMGVPKVTREQWVTLARTLKRRKVYVACLGGHGRTGTALAILASLYGAVPKDADPVAWVRGVYCDKAVETTGQADYVAKVTGRTVKAAPYKTGKGTTGPTLCPTKVGEAGDWCNLDMGHSGDHDTRPRATLAAEGLLTPSHRAKAMPATGGTGDAKGCTRRLRCVARDGHQGDCIGLDGAPLPPRGTKAPDQVEG